MQLEMRRYLPLVDKPGIKSGGICDVLVEMVVPASRDWLSPIWWHFLVFTKIFVKILRRSIHVVVGSPIERFRRHSSKVTLEEEVIG
jgi:hypothetical protein